MIDAMRKLRYTMKLLPSAARCRVRKESGQVLVWLCVSAVALLAMVGFVIDVGHVFNAHRELQASADAAALAGAQDLPDLSKATATALNFSSSPGMKNTHPDLSSVAATVTPKCFTSTKLPCNPANGIVVKESANVPTFFLKVIGINSLSINARSTASMKGGSALPLDVMIVLDRTGSMCSPCSKIANARAGVLAFLGAMRPSVDEIGLAVLPPASSVGARCSSPSSSWYDTASFPYTVVNLANNFRTSDSSGLNMSSDIVQTTNCMKTGGITSYATALEKAQVTLDTQGRASAQDVIIFFTDGEANYGPWYYGNSSTYRTRPCAQAIASAQTIRTKTWLYTIAYDTASSTRCKGYFNGSKSGTSCKQGAATQFACDEQPVITAIWTLEQMASVIDGQTKFYYQPTAGDLTAIFERVALDLTQVRLVDDDTP